MNEIWKPVVGYEGRYEVSNMGRVASLRYGGHAASGRKLLRLCGQPSGHLVVRPYRDGAGRTRHVHTLVLTAFVGPRPDGLEARHKDGNPTNNKLTNLEYATRSQNTLDRKWHNGTRTSVLKPADVRAIRRLLARGMPSRAVAEVFKVTPRNIRWIQQGGIHRDVLP